MLDLRQQVGADAAGGIGPVARPVPVRLPLPPAEYQGSIYENQTAAKNKYFKIREPA